MPGCYKIDKDRKLVMTTGYGVVTREDMLDHQRKLLADPDFDPTYSQLADFVHMANSKITAEDVRRVAETDVFAPNAKRAIIVPNDFTYGFARMFEEYREAKGETGIRVFRELTDGLEWIFSGQTTSE